MEILKQALALDEEHIKVIRHFIDTDRNVITIEATLTGYVGGVVVNNQNITAIFRDDDGSFQIVRSFIQPEDDPLTEAQKYERLRHIMKDRLEQVRQLESGTLTDIHLSGLPDTRVVMDGVPRTK